MLYPIKVVDIELSRPLQTIEGLDGYMGLQALVRLHGVPIGYVKAPITNGYCAAQTLTQLILEQHSWKIIQQLLQNGLAAPQRPQELRIEDLLDMPPPECTEPLPSVTVAVCTRDRPQDLALCLAALCQLDYPHLDLLVIDNAPTNDETKDLVHQQYPQVRYVREPRPGLDWARNRAILEAQGEIIAYTDDDVVVDRGWVKALAQVFAENPEVMAVTGLVVPYELETEAQVLFEKYGGFGRGFERKWYRVNPDQKVPWQWLGTGQFGTGANMAYRRCLFDQIGYFDPALDVGTITNGGGDLEMFFRVLKEGHTLVYEPQAVIRHRHRRDYAKLRTQITNNGIGLYSYFVREAIAYPDERWGFLYIAIWWLVWWHLRRLLRSIAVPSQFPRDLIWAEIHGFFRHFGRYQTARRQAEHIAAQTSTEPLPPKPSSDPIPFPDDSQDATAIRTVELSQPLSGLSDVGEYAKTQIFVTCDQQLLGSVGIQNTYQPIGKTRLIEAIASGINIKLFHLPFLTETAAWAVVQTALFNHYANLEDTAPVSNVLPRSVSVSVVVATFDRPNDLRHCLISLVAQRSTRAVEIIVVDNHPVSGLTAPIVSEFPGVKLVEEPRQGLAYARNAGIVASQGDIIVTTDDDVTMPPNWVETLVAPFARPDVMVVTGNVLPIELETSSQQLFEVYGGLGRGFQPNEVNGEWFEACPYRTVPTWNLGATANAAFRVSIFSHPQIGLIDESLGAGTSTGCSEDTYVFYKVLKAGYTIVYQPTAYVWHKHRKNMATLRRQIYNYSKGHVAYHLTTLINDGDWRVLARLFVGLPLVQCWRFYSWLRGWSAYPISLLGLEIAGNLAGSWALWRSRQRVKKLGCSSSLSKQQSQVCPQSIPSEQPAMSAPASTFGETTKLLVVKE
jgi:O-antigen biosynthesis protein